MSTATIQNIPTKIVKQYYNKKEDNYGPFNGAKEAISFLTRNRG